MTTFSIPAVCPTCGLVFPSGAAVGPGSSITMDNCGAACPNGHDAVILDGTYSTLSGLFEYFQKADGRPVAQAIAEIAAKVANKEAEPDQALDEVADLLPGELGKGVKKLGGKYPVLAILIIMLAVIGYGTNIASNIAAIFKSLSPETKTIPTIVINQTNNAPAIQLAQPGPSRQMRRQQERMQRKQRSAKKGSVSVKPKKK